MTMYDITTFVPDADPTPVDLRGLRGLKRQAEEDGLRSIR